jgi:hypothetical protein
MNEESFDLEKFQAEVDEVLSEQIARPMDSEPHPMGISSTGSSYPELLHTESRAVLLYRMLRLKQLSPEKRQQLKELHEEQKWLLLWREKLYGEYSGTRFVEFRDAIKYDKPYQDRYQTLREQIQQQWLILEKQVVQQERNDLLAELLGIESNQCNSRPLSLPVTSIEAREVLADPAVRVKLCAALKSGYDNIFELSKAITPVVATLALTGQLLIPLVPALFASIALFISHMGVAALCTDYKKPDKPDNE